MNLYRITRQWIIICIHKINQYFNILFLIVCYLIVYRNIRYVFI